MVPILTRAEMRQQRIFKSKLDRMNLEEILRAAKPIRADVAAGKTVEILDGPAGPLVIKDKAGIVEYIRRWADFASK
jgi:hypothetical protein